MQFASIHCEALGIIGITVVMVTQPQNLNLNCHKLIWDMVSISSKNVHHEVDSEPGGVIKRGIAVACSQKRMIPWPPRLEARVDL